MKSGSGIHSKGIAVVGAAGFVGSRLVETLHLSGEEVVPITRNVTGMARASRFDLKTRLADAKDIPALSRSLAGCDSVVHCVAGNPPDIVGAAKALVPACTAAGVGRLIYLSTASVHGQNPPPGTHEETTLHVRHPVAYNNAKVRAEWQVVRDAKRAGLQVVILRPGIVFGPRDRWFSDLSRRIVDGQAWLLNRGEGICNSIYVDNLIEAIQCGLKATNETGGLPYWVGDSETVSWRAFYQTICDEMNLDPDRIHQVQAPTITKPSLLGRLDALRAHPRSQQVIAWIPRRAKRLAKACWKAWPEPRPAFPWALPKSPGVQPDLEMSLLQQCSWKFPHERAQLELGYQPKVSFREGMRRTAEWCRWLNS